MIRDIWILLITALLMVIIMMTGRFLRGDFTYEAVSHAAISSDLGNLVVVEDGKVLLNINLADAETLTRVDGIGNTLAERIVSYREEHGDFISLDELIKVDGIGTKTLQKIREQLVCLP